MIKTISSPWFINITCPCFDLAKLSR